MIWRALLVVGLLFGRFTECARAEQFESPSGTATTTSPDGRYLVRQHIAADKDEGWDYRLTLTDRISKRRWHLYTHHRDLIARWSPDSTRIALSDFMGSDEGDCYLVRLPAVAFSSPDARIFRFMGGAKLVGGEINHLYFDCERWVSSRSIVIHVWGDGSIPGFTGPSKGFDGRVLYSLTGKMKLLSLKHE